MSGVCCAAEPAFAAQPAVSVGAAHRLRSGRCACCLVLWRAHPFLSAATFDDYAQNVTVGPYSFSEQQIAGAIVFQPLNLFAPVLLVFLADVVRHVTRLVRCAAYVVL